MLSRKTNSKPAAAAVVPNTSTKPMLSGVYGISLRRAHEMAPWFYDWVWLDHPHIGQTVRLRDGEQAIIAAASGTPPFGQLLCLSCPDQTTSYMRASSELVGNRYAQVLAQAHAKSLVQEAEWRAWEAEQRRALEERRAQERLLQQVAEANLKAEDANKRRAYKSTRRGAANNATYTHPDFNPQDFKSWMVDPG